MIQFREARGLKSGFNPSLNHDSIPYHPWEKENNGLKEGMSTGIHRAEFSLTWQYSKTRNQLWRWLGGPALKESLITQTFSLTWGPTWDPKIVISRATSRFPK